jgi:hypothetical protein
VPGNRIMIYICRSAFEQNFIKKLHLHLSIRGRNGFLLTQDDGHGTLVRGRLVIVGGRPSGPERPVRVCDISPARRIWQGLNM